MESKKRTLQTMSPLKIGNVEMQNPLVLAPMAGVTDLPFRVLCKEQGAGLICMEMVSAKAILYKNKNTEDLMTIHPGEHPVSLQLFGSDPKFWRRLPHRSRSGRLTFWILTWLPGAEGRQQRRGLRADEGSCAGAEDCDRYGKGSEKAGDS